VLNMIAILQKEMPGGGQMWVMGERRRILTREELVVCMLGGKGVNYGEGTQFGWASPPASRNRDRR